MKKRAIVKLVGGAEMPQNIGGRFNTGRRNVLAARNILWRNGVFVAAEDVGGTDARTVHLSVGGRPPAGFQRALVQGTVIMRILIVDDSAMMRAMIKRVVKLTNVPVEEILEAGDGAEALTLLEAHDVQLLLTDINMPVMTGADLLRELRQQRSLARPDARHHLDRRLGGAPRRGRRARRPLLSGETVQPGGTPRCPHRCCRSRPSLSRRRRDRRRGRHRRRAELLCLRRAVR